MADARCVSTIQVGAAALGAVVWRLQSLLVCGCSSWQYLLKTDDDCYIHVPNLLMYMQYETSLQGSAPKYIGSVPRGGFQPVRSTSSKWYTSKSDWPSEAGVGQKYAAGW